MTAHNSGTSKQHSSTSSNHYHHLLKKFVKRHKKTQKKLWDRHGKHLQAIQASQRKMLAGSMAGLILLAQPASSVVLSEAFPQTEISVERSVSQKRGALINELTHALPQSVESLSAEQEAQVSSILGQNFNMKVSAELEGKRLNRCYGLIGAEQHLMRYPGDTMASHFDNPADSERYYSSGMAPGRGAWGYFAHSQGGMTQQDVLREKYYIAVPTFKSPTWHENVNAHYKFFKYRKMLVVNPQNGKAIVADIGDAGPAPSTGKHLGGSPEVMKHLERVDGRAKGPVIYLFIDDPTDSIPLGPIDIQS